MLKKIAALFFLPPVLIAFISLAPFAIYWNEYLSAKALDISRTIGFDTSAFGYACLCVGAFSLAYFFVFFRRRHEERRQIVLHRPQQTRRLIFRVVVVLAVMGLAATVATVTVAGSGFITEMAGRFRAGEEATDLLYSPEGYIRSEYVSGLIRMLGGLSNASVLIWLSMAALPWRDLLKKIYWPGLGVLLTVNLVRGVLGGDRGPALVAFLLTAYVILAQTQNKPTKLAHRNRPLRTIGIALGLVIIVGTGLWAYIRLDKLRNTGEYNTMLYYSDMGVANLSLEMKTGEGMGYGYYTFGGPLSLVFRYLGISVAWPQFTAAYIGGPYLNLLGDAFADFGIYGFIIYGFLGMLSGWVHRNICVSPSRLGWRVAHLHLLWAFASAFTVPIFTGIQYWIGLFVALAISLLLDARGNTHAAPAVKAQREEKVRA